ADARSCLRNILATVSKYDRKGLFDCIFSHVLSEEISVIDKITVLQDIDKLDINQKLSLSAGKISDFLSEITRKRKIVELEKGICYGQSMKVLELVGSHDSSIITEDWLYQKMALADSVRYQILHYLDLFVRGQKSAYIFGVSKELAKEKIAQSFPHCGK